MLKSVIISLFSVSLLLAQFNLNDDFNDGAIQFSHWSNTIYYGSGAFNAANNYLEYTCSNDFNYSYLAKIVSASYDQDFSVLFRSQNTTNAFEDSGQYAQIGIRIFRNSDYSKWLNVCHGSYYVSGFGGSRDILTSFYNNGVVQGTTVQALNIFPQSTVIKASFNSSTKVFSVYYDENPTDGIQWSLLSTFGVDALGNGAHNLDLEMTSEDSFKIIVYALSNGLEIQSGELLIDDFQAWYEDSPTLTTSNAVNFNFESELGKNYQILKSSTPGNETPYEAIGLSKSALLYELVPLSEGTPYLSGTGNQIFIIDTLKDNENAFYKVQTY